MTCTHCKHNREIERLREICSNCRLGEDVFEGSMLLLVYGAPGSAAETYCETHENCFFVADTGT